MSFLVGGGGDEIRASFRKWFPIVMPVKQEAFLGLLHCSTCGGAITAEVQKGHTYYRVGAGTKGDGCEFKRRQLICRWYLSLGRGVEAA
jgi:hypothetical protein